MRVIGSTWTISILASIAPMFAASEYKAGVARLDITPATPIRMAGYGGRDQLSQSVAMRLYAKALAIEDRKGGRLVLVTTDLLGLPRSVSDVVGARVEKEYGLERSRLILNSSHTHAGPIVGLEGRLASELRDEQKRVVMEYRNALVEQLVTVAGAALRDLTEVEITFGTGEATFAVNRRLKGPQGVQIGVNPQGPTDPQVPVILVSRRKGAVLAVIFGYACHNTTLVSDNRSISGDYAGQAQIQIEKQHPGSTAMFLMLCGGDQNPNPRGRPEFVEQHGGALATEVLRVTKGKLERLSGAITTAYNMRELALAEPLAKPVPYPVQAVRFGKSLTLVALGGEVVIEYALRLKREFPKEHMIVAAYSNDVMAYIPTSAMLKEGGYEPVTSMTYYGFGSPFAPDVEERVMNGVREVLRRVGVR
jgi:neutral ceramidase